MQIVAVPLYNSEMSVEAYMFRDLKDNNLFSTSQTLNLFDGASSSQSMEVLDKVGLEPFTLGKPIFIPVKEMLFMGNPHLQCKVPPDKIVFVVEEPISKKELYLPFIQRLKDLGYRFAANYKINFDGHDDFLDLCSFIFLSYRPERVENTNLTLSHVKRNYRHLMPIAVHIYTADVLKSLYGKGYGLYESRFYRVTSKGMGVAPLKMNALRLINTVQDDNFDFEEIIAAVRSDPALTISLLRIVNMTLGSSAYKVSTIPHAVALLGQREVRKWVTTAVSESLGDDMPNEITRISLIRARFCEKLAPMFELAHMSNDLFMLGLFSVLDVILELPMQDAIKQVSVSDNVRKALTEEAGILYPIIKFVTDYEIASWSAVSRQMIVNNISDDALSEAYLESLIWYKDLIASGDQTDPR